MEKRGGKVDEIESDHKNIFFTKILLKKFI